MLKWLGRFDFRKLLVILLLMVVLVLGGELFFYLQLKKDQEQKPVSQPTEISKPSPSATEADYAWCWLSDYPAPQTQTCNLIGTVLAIATEQEGIVSVLLGSLGEKHTIGQDPRTKQKGIHKGWRAKLYFPPAGWLRPDWPGSPFRDEQTKEVLGVGNDWFLANVKPGARLRAVILVRDGSAKATTDYGRQRAKMAYEVNKTNVAAFLAGEDRLFEFWPGNVFIIKKE